MQALLLLATASVCAAYIEPSNSPPGGLDVANTPQFILFTHDDAVLSSTHELMKSVTDGRSFSGCPATATLFVATQIGNDCDLMMDLYNSGYEVADHTQTHETLKGLKESKLEEEVLGARSDLVACGVPQGDVAGMRAPFLNSDAAVRQVLSENGFLYDSSLIEEGKGASLSKGMGDRVWPFQMDGGVPINCDWFGDSQQCSTSESWPGLFEVPVWQLLNDDGVWSMDYGQSPSADAYRVLKNAFDAAYSGNRAPLPIFIHTPWLEEHAGDVKRFLGEAAARGGGGSGGGGVCEDEVSDPEAYPNVYMVTIRQLLAWMQNPVPADQLTPEALGCGLPGGAPGTGGASGGRTDTASPPPPDGSQQQTAAGGSGEDGGEGGVSTYAGDGSSEPVPEQPRSAADALAELGFKLNRKMRAAAAPPVQALALGWVAAGAALGGLFVGLLVAKWAQNHFRNEFDEKKSTIENALLRAKVEELQQMVGKYEPLAYKSMRLRFTRGVNKAVILGLVDELLSKKEVNIWWLPDSLERIFYVNIISLLLSVLDEVVEGMSVNFAGHNVKLQLTYLDLDGEPGSQKVPKLELLPAS
ncbi:hypothetical protein CHLNCDRAFT_139978 [Chlorella variabilis]|uniref:NodB homology domain-containing protein n=1 Tax=Chlorella variabilis TaxID=554065 RepID=E1ZRB1_CHLVA|nr:hypothetical protein CHLNCDRAFT_139978 [Chlorella variabilis]EFN51596.1 hypothetical protein CHLNCDRAFT_139978 [Chlorella variabilis]|eukprot:XP_005843698.1 hypothetical protein CHLNCDRAFT_139978 [Chlorella variabilis]